MRFHLVYNGPLPPSGNSSKPEEVARIREALHPQLAYLWEVNSALKVLRWKARVPASDMHVMANGDSPLYQHYENPPANPVQPGFVDLTKSIELEGKRYIPLIRKSLDLNCELDILFLRQEDPGQLVF